MTSLKKISFTRFEIGDYKSALDDIKKLEVLFNKLNKKDNKLFLSKFLFDELVIILKIYKSNNHLEKCNEILYFLYENNTLKWFRMLLYPRFSKFINSIIKIKNRFLSYVRK